ncbi:hypothetical protein [Paracoccus mutanolyticus]|nr:hypothetical protein [Paracoccus mutanolyticus]
MSGAADLLEERRDGSRYFEARVALDPGTVLFRCKGTANGFLDAK